MINTSSGFKAFISDLHQLVKDDLFMSGYLSRQVVGKTELAYTLKTDRIGILGFTNCI